MTRTEIKNDILQIKSNNLLLLLATSIGKSKLALDFISKNFHNNPGKILIVVPRLVLIENWKEEIKKWYDEDVLNHTEFTTYISLHKHNPKEYAWTIFDECHHLSERCLDYLTDNTSTNNILLSATVKKDHLIKLKYTFNNLYIYKMQLKEAIDNNILPDPNVYLIPLALDNKIHAYSIVKHKGKKDKITITYELQRQYIFNNKYKETEITILCTQQQYYNEMCSLIQYYKNKSYIPLYKNKWLKCCSDRLKWLSEQKTKLGKEILSKLDNKRVLTFCSSIKQTEQLGENCINSKNKKSKDILNKFQEHKINHITACDMLNEGMNLKDCQVGLFISLHSSNIIISQRNGRLLRHKEPIFIIPYFCNTRDEEIVEEMLKDYNKDLIHYDKSFMI